MKALPIVEGLQVSLSLILCCILIGHVMQVNRGSGAFDIFDLVLIAGAPFVLIWSTAKFLGACE